MLNLYQEILFRPLFNLLVFIYNVLPGNDFGWAIVILTVIIRLIFVPFSIKTLISQRELNRLQPKLKELQEKHKNDRQALGKATIELYRENKVNPFSGCLTLLIQIPVLIALYSALNHGFKSESFNLLYSFVKNPGVINYEAFGFLSLSTKSAVLAITAGLLQGLQTKISLSFQKVQTKGVSDSTAALMNKQMLYFFPLMVIIIAWNLPSGLVLYWVTTTLFSILEQLYINRSYRPSAENK